MCISWKKRWRSLQCRFPPRTPIDHRVVTVAYWSSFVKFVTSVKLFCYLKKTSNNLTNCKCSAFATYTYVHIFHFKILQFVLVGAQTIFCLGRRGPDNGYAADYGTSRKLQKYDIIDVVAELEQNHSNYSLNTTTVCYSGKFTT